MTIRSILYIGVISVLFGCNTAPEAYVLEGEITGEIENGTQVILQTTDSLAKNLVAVDTTELVDGLFKFSGTVDEPKLHYLTFDGLQGAAPIVVENGDINFKAQKDSLAFSTIKGTPQNDMFMDYLTESRRMAAISKSFGEDYRTAQRNRDTAAIESLRAEYFELQEKAKNVDIDFMKENPDALISVLILERAVKTKGLPAKELKAIYDAMTSEIKQSNAGKRVGDQIDKLVATAIGSKAPVFSGPTPDGNELALTDVKGKVILIDFWAAWCKPCRSENPNIVSVFNDYKDKGFNVVGVSLDKKAEDWKKAISDDGLAWDHVSHLQYFQDPIAIKYQVNSIPAAFLLDENGVIIAKNLRGSALREKVSQLLD